tara:strand:+ start:59 stop:160 length:102 start_codon:yes stop_codon:yes gene_type:complete
VEDLQVQVILLVVVELVEQKLQHVIRCLLVQFL